MIKNILYSLFLHFLLITLIYANFNLRDVPKLEVKEISISLLEVKAEYNINKEQVNEQKPIEHKQISKEPEKQKETPKKEVKEEKPKEEEKKPQPSQKQQSEKKEEVKKQETTKKEVTKQIIEDKPKKDEEDKEKEIKKEEPKKEEEKKPKEEEAEEQPKKEEETKEIKADLKENEQSVNNLENLNLSVREKFNIRSQLKMCYRRARTEYKLEKSQFKVTIIAEIAQDGFIYSNLEEITDHTKYKEDRDYRTAINAVERAINLCNPLRNLPPDKYNIWKKVLLEFGEDNAKIIQDEKK